MKYEDLKIAFGYRAETVVLEFADEFLGELGGIGYAAQHLLLQYLENRETESMLPGVVV